MLNLTGVVLAASMVVGQASEPPSNYQHLKGLEWMIGTWQTEVEAEMTLPPVTMGDTLVVTVSTDWALNRNVLESTMTVKKKSGDIMLMTTKILRGWDAAKKKIRGATFSSMGGIGHVTVAQVGDEWHGMGETVLPDGKREKNTMIFSKITSDSFDAQQVNRTRDGKELPDLPVWTVKRVNNQ